MIDKNLPVLPLKDVYYDQQRVALDQSDNLPRSRVHSKIGTISKYHENCHSECTSLLIKMLILL